MRTNELIPYQGLENFLKWEPLKVLEWERSWPDLAAIYFYALLDSEFPQIKDVSYTPLCSPRVTALDLQHGGYAICTGGVCFKSFLQYNLGDTFCAFPLKRKLPINLSTVKPISLCLYMFRLIWSSHTKKKSLKDKEHDFYIQITCSYNGWGYTGAEEFHTVGRNKARRQTLTFQTPSLYSVLTRLPFTEPLLISNLHQSCFLPLV